MPRNKGSHCAIETNTCSVNVEKLGDSGKEIMTRSLCQVKTAWPRLMLDSARAGNVLTNLLPTHTASWWPLVEDIFRSTECLSLMSRLLRMAVRHDEYKYLSVDGTFRVCLSLLGQAGFNEPAAVRQQYPFKDDTSFRRIITMRGRTGAVLGLVPCTGEGAEEVSSCIQKALPDQALEQVKCVATDNPSSKLMNVLAQRLPNLSCVVLDATHASMHYEEATGGRRTGGSSMLRRFMAKFCGKDSSWPANLWGNFYDGSTLARLSAPEQSLARTHHGRHNAVAARKAHHTRCRRLARVANTNPIHRGSRSIGARALEGYGSQGARHANNCSQDFTGHYHG